MFFNDKTDTSTIRGKSLVRGFADVSVTVRGPPVSLAGVVVTGNTGGVPKHNYARYQAPLTQRAGLAYQRSGPRISSKTP